MYKLVRGKGSKEFGQVEWMLSMNFSSLLTALLVAFLGWFGSEALPVLGQHQVLSAGTLGTIAMLIPVVVNWLKDNKNVSVEQEIPSKKNR